MLPSANNPDVNRHSAAAPSVEAIAAFTPELDRLALQVMLCGAKACAAEGLAGILSVANAFSLPILEQFVHETLELQSQSSLSDEDAKLRVSQMQRMLSPAVKAGESGPIVPDTSAFAFVDDPELLNDFVMEADEHLASIEEKILLLEKDSSLIEAIHSVFRSFHSIKGLAGFLNLSGVQAVAHEVETLLDHARNLRITVDSNIVDIVLESSEYLKDEVEVIRSRLAGTAIPSVRDNTDLLAMLVSANADFAAGRPLFAGREAPVTKPRIETASEIPATAPAIPSVPVDTLMAEDPSEESSGSTLIETVAETPAAPLMPPGLTIVRSQTAGKSEAQQAAAPSSAPRAEAANTSIRVETAKLDRLMDMVGEMVIAQSILSNRRRESSSADAAVAGEMSQLARITSEVQRCAMSMRMMPIGPLFQRNAKMVRDLSRRNGKLVSLELFGEATELDKSIAEELSDPLLHMIRNALDHGIETPAERALTGKPATASLRIAAEHQAGQIVISISDDGRGLDPGRIRAKAVQNGLIEDGAQLSEAEIFHLIFAPGFSTAEKITDISGRGVGMDVVRQHVESLRGRIEIRSKLGEGTTFFIHLPLTLAIIEGLVIIVGEHRYIIPLYSVREMIRPTQDMLYTVQGADEMILMRGSLLPLVRLHQRFGITPRTNDICDGLLVVCEFAGKRYCLFVDDLLGRQEVVIKSLDEAFRRVRGLVGSAILGDGRIGLILDVAGVFDTSSLQLEARTA